MLSPKSADGQNEAWIHGLIKCNANPSHHLANSHWAGRWNHSGSHVAAPVKPFHLRGSDCVPVTAAQAGREAVRVDERLNCIVVE